MKYRVIEGMHVEDDPNGKRDEAGKLPDRILRKGQVFDTDNPNLARNYPEKFERIYSEVEGAARAGYSTIHSDSARVPDGILATLEAMTTEELVSYCQQEEIAHDPAWTREQLLSQIVGGRR